MGITVTTRKALWGKSGNKCSFPDCKQDLVMNESETDGLSVIGEEAHIVARKEKGPRGKSELPKEQRDEYNNLILLCSIHHKRIDDQENIYTIDLLHQYKKEHENWVSSNLSLDKIEEIKSEFTFQPDQNWFKNQCESSIHDLGKRYTPELNVELKISEIFEGLGRTEKFKNKITESFDRLLIKGKKVLRKQPEVKESIGNLQNHFDELDALFRDTEFLGTVSLPIEKLAGLLESVQSSVQIIYEEKDDYQYYNNKYSSELTNIREFENEISNFQDLIHSSEFKLANNPFLLIEGEAGIGKSHLIGDIVSRRIKANYESVFLLGQHFATKEDPWTQIFKRLQINSKSEDFLKKLNQRAEKSEKRIVLFIDAINEGKGRYFWEDSIRSFINDIKKYKWLGLVLTIRTSYKNLIFPKDEMADLDIVEHYHYGFENIEYDASKLFFDNYGIKLPSVPLLRPEFQNPLFLKLFCEGINKAGLTCIPDGLQGITSIINFFVKNVNRVLSKPNRVGYSSNSLNLVQKSIDALIKHKVDKQLKYAVEKVINKNNVLPKPKRVGYSDISNLSRKSILPSIKLKVDHQLVYVPYESAYKVIDESISTFVNKKGFIDELIEEGILSKDAFWKGRNDYEERVDFAYERFGDHLTVQYLLGQYPDLEKEFKEGGKLHSYVKDEVALKINKGLIEAFSIQVPERNGCEFFNLIPTFKDKCPVIESFVESLLWRKIDTINEESNKYVNEHVFSYQGTHDYFWETILAVTGIPKHYFNAHFLHNLLMNLSLAERDANWTQFLKYQYSDESSVKRLIDWAWNQTDKSHISDESVMLCGITLTWFHTSTNRKLRDCSTKALVCLLQDRVEVLIKILKMFEGVNDPYVYERLFAVAYGCAVRTEKKEELTDLSIYIYQTIFKDKDEVYPHVLLRDYARGVIEFTNYSGFKLPFDLEGIRPPYKSSFPKTMMTNDEIDEKYKFDRYDEDFKERYISQNYIIRSMTTEYGRGMCHYGDFGRYTFESALSYWDVNTNDLSNLAVEWIFEKYGYDVDKHGEFDLKIGSGRGRSTIPHERIGKKYQWIAFYEMVARVSDNFKKYKGWKFEKEEEEPYQGPWDTYVRDIDPTMLISKTGNCDDEQPQYFWWTNKENFNWDCSNENWVKQTKGLPSIKNIIQVKDDNGDEWLMLEGYSSWPEPKKIGEEIWNQPRKELRCQIRSYIVKDDEYNSFKDWAVKQEFMGRRMPESGDRYEMFSREYYWSPAQSYFMTEWTEVQDNGSGKYIAEVNVTAQGFLWEEEYDRSKEDAIRFLKPSKLIYEGMNLKHSQKEGEFLNISNEIQCFATNVYHDSASYLLIKKVPFLKFLQDNNLNIVWTVLGEKGIISGQWLGTDDLGRLEINGAYYFDKNGEIMGNLNTKNT